MMVWFAGPHPDSRFSEAIPIVVESCLTVKRNGQGGPGLISEAVWDNFGE